MQILRHFTFLVTLLALAACGGGGGGSDNNDDNNPTVTQCGTPTGGTITIDGKVTFELVPHDSNGPGLDYASASLAPARRVIVEALDTNDTVIDRDETDAAGDYTLEVPDNTLVTLRVRCEMINTEHSPTWQFSVHDNTHDNALYALRAKEVCTTTADETRNLIAPSGWDGSQYSDTRVAAPLAILDAIYDGMEFLLNADVDQDFRALRLFWSENNTVEAIGTSLYDGQSIYLLGDENVDTDEYDKYVILHEFAHYLEDVFSRTDNIGGIHNAHDYIDMRVAFSEGLATAFSAMSKFNPLYRDSMGAGQGSGYSFDIEQEGSGTTGWYSEISVEKILYDLVDSNNDAADSDNVTLGFERLADVLINEHRNQVVFNSIFKFIYSLKERNPLQAAAIDNLVVAQDIHVFSEYGDYETNDAGLSGNLVLPIFHTLTIYSNEVVCATRRFNRNLGTGDTNVLGMRRFVTFTVPVSGYYRFTVLGDEGANPDVIFRDNNVGYLFQDVTNYETFVLGMPAREYMIEIFDRNLLTGSGEADDQCFTVNVELI